MTAGSNGVDLITETERTLIERTTLGVTLVCIALILVGCGVYTRPSPLILGSLNLGSVLYCKAWTEFCASCGGGAESREPKTPVPEIGIVIHLMLADIDAARRKKEYNVDHAWALAPVQNAASMTLDNVVVGEPGTTVEFWTRPMIHRIFGKDGKLNAIWRDYHHLIQLNLLGGEDCLYSPGALRPDGLVRDSMLTPDSSTPWTGQFFHSINRLFTGDYPHVLHILLWWSVAEGDIDDISSVSGAEQLGGTRIWGHSRSATRGGPAVWVGAYECLMRTAAESTTSTQEGCAKVIAHEIGHALGLHHVDLPNGNLMYFNQAVQKGVILSDSQKQQILQEAVAQFRSR